MLRTQKLGEADRIITVLGRNSGRIRAVAKGVRRTKSRFGARLEPFTHVDLMLHAGRSLDVITQAEILDLFGRLSRELEMAVLFISHDLLSVARLCHQVAILHAGEIVEVAPTREIFETPRHPYTQRLVAALPQVVADFNHSAVTPNRTFEPVCTKSLA